MPRKCSIGCSGNYNKRKKPDTDNKCIVFRFPKDPQRIAEWLRKIPQQLTEADITEYMGICDKHFDSRFVLRDYSARRPDGTVISVPRNAPVLSDDAVPTIFPNTASYLSTVSPPARTDPDFRRAAVSARDDAMLQDWLDQDCVNSFDNFLAFVECKTAELCPGIICAKNDDFVLFVNIDCVACPRIVYSFKVLRDLTVCMFDGKEQLDTVQLAWLLGEECKLTRWSQLPNICSSLRNVTQSDGGHGGH